MTKFRSRLARRARGSRFWGFVYEAYEWLRPPRQLSTTTLGKLVIVFAIVIGVAATNTGNNLLYLVLGGLFGIIAASGVLSERALKRIEVELRVPRVTIAERPVGLAVTLTGGERADAFLLEIQVLDAEENVLGSAPLRELLRLSRRTVTVKIEPQTRGALSVLGVRVGTRFPFQMYEKARIYPRPATLWVAPAPTPAVLPKPSVHADPAQARKARAWDGDQFQGLRERLPSDPLSRVHWKRAASLDTHVVKVFSADDEPHVRIDIFRGASLAAFEAGLAEVSGLLEIAERQQRAVNVAAGALEVSMQADGAGKADVLLLLARLQRDDVAPGAAATSMSVAA